METSGVRTAPCRPRLNLPTSGPRVIDRAGALPLIVAPAQVLDDPPRVADRLAVDLEHGDDGLTGERLDLLALAAPPRDTPLLGIDPAQGELACDLPARAQAVRRRLAA